MKIFFVAMLLMATILVLTYGAPIEQNETASLAIDESSSVPAVKPLKKSHKSKVTKVPKEIGKKKPTSPKENKKVKVTDSGLITWNVPAIEVEHRPVSLTGHSILSDGLFGDPESYRFLHPFERF